MITAGSKEPMPYSYRKKGHKWEIVKKDTGEVVGTSDSKKDAMASGRARMAGEHMMKPKK